MNPAPECGVIKPPKTDIYSEAPQNLTPRGFAMFRCLATSHGGMLATSRFPCNHRANGRLRNVVPHAKPCLYPIQEWW